MQPKALSKLLSYVLRHHPESLGLSLAPGGWLEVDALLAALEQDGRAVDRALLRQVVAQNDKQRFAFSEDGTQIRASQGHSLRVELGLDAVAPPERLFHGTVAKFLAAIREQGLIKGDRQHVHLSQTREVALNVAARRGQPVVLQVHAAEMARSGLEFFCSDNGVWLTDHVPSEFIDWSWSPAPHDRS